MIENVYAYVYSFITETIMSYPKVNLITNRYDTIPDKLDYKSSIYHIVGDGIISKCVIFGPEGTVLKDTQSLVYTVWFKDSNPKEAYKLIYEQLCNDTEENIQDIERRLNREKQRLLCYKSKLAEVS